MSVSELNHLMTYVIEGWMLFSAGFTSIAFVSFVARRVQEDAAAAELAQLEGQAAAQSEQISESESLAVAEAVEVAVKIDAPLAKETITEEEKEAARLEEVAAVSEKLAKAKEKQSNASSVSVSTGPQ